MPQRKVYLGIDFGTSNSSIAYVLGGDPRDAVAQKIPVHIVKVSMDEEGGAKAERLPSVLAGSLDRRSRKPLLGWEFFHELLGRKRKTGLLRHGETFFRSVKSDLGSLRVYPHACMAEFQTPEKVAAAILKRLLKEAEEALPGYNLKKAQVVISVPASLNTLGRGHTLEAARLAGLDTDSVQLVDEPVAALLDWLNDGRAAGVLDTSKPKNVLVFDYGGGTLDLSLVRARFDPTNKTTGLHVENLAISQYRRLGGDDVDRAVMSEVVWPQIEEQRGTERDALPADLRQQIEDTLIPTVARRLKEGICRKIKEASRDGHRSARKLEHIEPLQAIFEEIELPRNFKITADGFQEVMWPFLMPPNEDVLGDEDLSRQCLLVPVLEVLKRGGIATEELHALVLHGGSCRNPLVRELLTETFGDQTSLFHNTQVLETPDLDTSVAKGAALTAYWRHERDTHIVAPIIAEDIGILTLDDKPVKLLGSGQPLPFPDGERVHEVPVPFYVPQSKLRHLLVPFYTGQHTRRITESVHVDLPPETPRGTKVVIKLRVDSNKALHWWYSVGSGPFKEAKSLNDPWTAELPSPAMRNLLDHRRRMREEIQRTGHLDQNLENTEANLLRLAGRLDEAELLLQDLIRHYAMDATRANILGLIASARGDKSAALKWYEKAATLNPKNAVLVGNYGYLLADCGRAQEAEAKMRQALGMDATLRYLYQRLGDLYRGQANEEAARREYREALRLARQETTNENTAQEAWWAIADLCHKLGDYDQANEARARAQSMHQSAWLGGDHRHRIAGPDSGVITSDEVVEGI